MNLQRIFIALCFLIINGQSTERSGQFNRLFSNFRSRTQNHNSGRAISQTLANSITSFRATKTTTTSTTPATTTIRSVLSAGSTTQLPISNSTLSGLYYSWRDPALGPHVKYTWQRAERTCAARGQSLVSLQTAEKNSHILAQIDADNVEYIWTSGQRRGPVGTPFVWATGEQVLPLAWSRRGAIGRPQPDNREGDEHCLAVLNRFYPGDGITWHDVACGYRKPFVCE